MTKETISRLREHFKKLISGSANTGNKVRDELIISDATKHLAELNNKFPEQKPKSKAKEQ